MELLSVTFERGLEGREFDTAQVIMKDFLTLQGVPNKNLIIILKQFEEVLSRRAVQRLDLLCKKNTLVLQVVAGDGETATWTCEDTGCDGFKFR